MNSDNNIQYQKVSPGISAFVIMGGSAIGWLTIYILFKLTWGLFAGF